MFDITQFDSTDTTFMHLKSPVDEEPIFIKVGIPDTVDQTKAPVGITFHTPGSAAYEAAVSRRTNRALHRSKRKIDVTADILRSDTVSFLTDCTVSFDNLGYPPADGATGEDLFKSLYADRKYGWVIEQANAHLGDWASFTKGSPKS